MLPSSVRRVVAAAPHQSPLLSPFCSTSARAPAALAFSCNTPCQQQRRRYSSSKPSSPNDSPKGISDGQVTTAPAQSTKQSGEKRRRKAKDSVDLPKLPSVPSTQHVPNEKMALSAFWSLHRPMSVTHSYPKVITDDAFAQIFAPRSKSNKYSDVVSTISQSVDQLEQPMQSLSLGEGEAVMDPNSDQVHKIDLKHPDGTESSVYVQLNTMSGQFLPFRPPPLPGSSGQAAEVKSERATAATEMQEPQHRTYKAIFTLEETIDETGDARIVAHSPQLIEEGDASVPRTFVERMALRQIRREHVRGQSSDMYAISVRRQRKLKMKKKKYKKLMKRTRTLRRKMDRL
ncbi:hypothetical protein F5X96DRAFT_639406 [Biscogniauxia mediterranea]|nr:hypothetical protein F5X96DRAFT_639406 [Biscogniauxia mediterranea]